MLDSQLVNHWQTLALRKLAGSKSSLAYVERRDLPALAAQVVAGANLHLGFGRRETLAEALALHFDTVVGVQVGDRCGHAGVMVQGSPEVEHTW